MACPPPGRDVFISYAGADRDLAAALARELDATDVATWWDALLIEEEPFETQVQRVLAETKLIVAVLSRQALASEWVRWELSQASQHGLHVVPLLVDGVQRDELPPPLHLLACLTLPAGKERSLRERALEIAALAQRVQRRPSGQRAEDARRRLASAAARTAREAAGIRFDKLQRASNPPLLVRRPHDGAPGSAAMHYAGSDGLADFLRSKKLSLALTAAPSGDLVLVGTTAAGQLLVDVRAFRKPTGLHVSGGSLFVGTLAHLQRLENILRAGQVMDGLYSHCFVPRTAYFTGVLDIHDVGFVDRAQPILIATRYNCLASVSRAHSFKPLWRPPFVSALVGEDRCHLNGLALSEGRPAYVTVTAISDSYDGWRERVADGGIVMDVRSDAVVCSGLSMPHSPRVENERLWVLNSGAGELGLVVGAAHGRGRYEVVARCPGFTRGLALHGEHAFVGVSRPRYDDFAGLALERRLRERGQDPWCGVQIIDTRNGELLHWLRIDGSSRELYDVAVLPGVTSPRATSDLDDEGFELITVEGEADGGHCGR
jgi:uncharacterized protein (TIGR03032 family)